MAINQTRKASDLPPIGRQVTDTDLIMVVADGSPPDLALAPANDLATLAGSHAPAGPVGPVGPTGPPGAPGADLTITGTVATRVDLDALSGVAANEVWLVADTGTIWLWDDSGQAWVQITAGVGAQGPAGPAGATGPAGAVGPAGAIGPQGPAGASTAVPTGTVLTFAGLAAPTGYHTCDGSWQDPTAAEFVDLHAAIGYTYGQDAQGRFRLPPMNGRVPVGVDPADTTFGVVGKTIGAKNASIPSHSHAKGTLTVANHRHTLSSHTHKMSHTHSVNPPPTNLTTINVGGQEWHVPIQSSKPATVGLRNHGITVGSGVAASFGYEGQGGLPHLAVNISPFDTGGSAPSATEGPSNNNSGYTKPSISGSTATAGVSATNANIQPSIVLNYIIKL